MKKNRFQLVKWFLGLMLLLAFCPVAVTAQSLKCGSQAAPPPNGNNPDSLISDRFGNLYDLEDLLVPQPLGSPAGSCPSGFFNLTFDVGFPMAMRPTVCQVFANLSTMIVEHSNTLGCGDVIPSSAVEIDVVWKAITPSVILGTGSPFYNDPTDPSFCPDLVLDRAFIKINGGIPSLTGIFDGRLEINSMPKNAAGIALPWHIDWATPVGAGEVDLYSVTLHEALHILGFASRITLPDYSLWDRIVHITDNFIPNGGSANIRPLISTHPLNPPCEPPATKNCWYLANGINSGNLQTTVSNTCSANNATPDVVVGEVAIAAVDATNTGGLSAQLSHLSETCNGSSEVYVMRGGFDPGMSRRVISGDELAILCELGYEISTLSFSCQGCYNIANFESRDVSDCCYQVFHGCVGQPIEVLNSDLLCNDLTNGEPQKIIRVWHSNSSTQIAPNSAGNGWLITMGTNGATYLDYTVLGCDCRMHNARFNVLLEKQCPPCAYNGDACGNLLCYYDFEDYTNLGGIETWLGYPFLIDGNVRVGTPDISVANGNHYLFMGASGGFSNSKEPVVMELNECVPPGCSLTLNADLGRSAGAVSATLNVWGSAQPPCPATIVPLIPIADNCTEVTVCAPGHSFAPTCVGSLPVEILNNSTFEPINHVTHIWENLTNEDVCYLTFVPSDGSVSLDNISATRSCKPEITCNFTGDKVCAGRTVNLPFQICAPDVPAGVDFTLITPSINLPIGWTVVSGLDPFPLTDEECIDIIIQVQVPTNAPIGSVNSIVLSGTATGLCSTIEWSCEASVTVEDCGPEGFTCGCIGSNVLNVDCGEPSVNPTDPNAELTSILDTDIPGHTVNFLIWPHTLFNTCLAVKGNLVIDNNYDLFIFGGEVRMQPGARIIVKSGAKLTLGLINSGTGTGQGIHGCEKMWRSIEVEPGGILITGYNVVQDGEFAFDIKSSPTAISTFSCAENDFNRNHVGVRVNNTSFASLNQDFGFSKNKFRATNDLLPKFSNDFNNWDHQYPYAGLFVRNTSFFVGASGNAGSDNLFDGLRNGIIADRAALFVYYATIQNLKGAPNIFQPNIDDSRRIGIFARSCNKFEVLNSNIVEAERGIFATRSSINFRNNTINPADIGLDFHSPLHQSIVIRDNDIYYRLFGVNVTEAETATLLHIAENDPMVQVPSAIDALNKTAIGIGGGASVKTLNGRIWNNKIKIPGYGVGISLGLVGNLIVHDNEITYDGATPPPGSMILDGVFALVSNSNYFYHNSVFGDNEAANLNGFHLFMAEKNKFCCNETNGIAYGFAFEGVCADTKLRHSDIGNHRVGLNIPYGYIDDQEIAGNHWNGTYPEHSAYHLGGVSDVQNSEFKVELPVGTTLWPVMPSSPSAPNQWFIPWPGNSTYCSSDMNNCPLPGLPDFSGGYPPRDFTGSELQTASYGFDSTPYGEMLQFESGRSLYRKLREDYSLLGNNAYIDGFYALEENSVGVLDEVDTQIAEMWAIDSATQAQVVAYQQTLDGIVVEINRIDSLYPFAQTYADTLVLQNHKKVFLEALLQPMVNLQNLTEGLTTAQQAKVPSILALNQSLSISTTLVSNRKTVNQIYLESIALGVFTLDAAQQNALLGVATQCPKLGGDAVLQARELYTRLVRDTIFDDEVLCETGARGRGTESEVLGMQPRNKVLLVPNPTLDHFTLRFSGLPISTPITVRIFDTSGKGYKELIVHNGEILSHSFAPGLYFCHVYIGEEIADIIKLVVIK